MKRSPSVEGMEAGAVKRSPSVEGMEAGAVKRTAYFLAVPVGIGRARGREYQRRKFFVCTSSLEDARLFAALVPHGYCGWALRRMGGLEERVRTAQRLGIRFVEISTGEYEARRARGAGSRVLIDERPLAFSLAEAL